MISYQLSVSNKDVLLTEIWSGHSNKHLVKINPQLIKNQAIKNNPSPDPSLLPTSSQVPTEREA
jgi:hypothetical protein